MVYYGVVASMATVTAIASSAKKRNCLTSKKQIEVINYAKKNLGMNIRSLADIFKLWEKSNCIRSSRTRTLYYPCMSPMPLAVESMLL